MTSHFVRAKTLRGREPERARARAARARPTADLRLTDGLISTRTIHGHGHRGRHHALAPPLVVSSRRPAPRGPRPTRATPSRVPARRRALSASSRSWRPVEATRAPVLAVPSASHGVLAPELRDGARPAPSQRARVVAGSRRARTGAHAHPRASRIDTEQSGLVLVAPEHLASEIVPPPLALLGSGTSS